VNGIDFLIVTALVLLVALAVAAGLQFAQDRAEAHLAAVSNETRELQLEQQRSAPMRYCTACGHELYPPI
jgi:type II secretory pathway pseudopilin PulG